MGFGAGFGEGFSRAYENKRASEDAKSEDTFRYRMESLIKRRDQYDGWKRDDAKYANQAKAIVQAANLPPDAVASVYGLLKDDGITFENALKFAQTNKYKVAAQGQSDTDKQMTDAGMDANDVAPPTAPTEPQQTKPQTSTAPSFDGGGFLSQIFPGMKKFQAAQAAPQGATPTAPADPYAGNPDVEARVQSTMGVTPDQIAELDKPYESPTMPGGTGTWEPTAPEVDVQESGVKAAQVAADANAAVARNPSDPNLKAVAEAADRHLKAIQEYNLIQSDNEAYANGQEPRDQGGLVKVPDKAGGYKYIPAEFNSETHTYMTPDGTPLPGAVHMSKDEREALAKVAQELAVPAKSVSDKSTAWAGMVRAGAGMRGAVERTHGAVLQDLTATIAQFGQGLTGELAAAADVLGKSENQAVGDIDPAKIQDTINHITRINDAYSKSDAGKLAKERLLFKAQNNLMAYYYGMAFNQQGRALSETERKMFEGMTAGGNDPKQFYEVLAGNLLPLEKEIDNDGSALQNSPVIRAHVAQWGGIPDLFNPTPARDYLKGDKGANDLLAAIAPYEGSATGSDVGNGETPPPPATSPTAPPANTPVTPTDQTRVPQIKNAEDYAKLPPGTEYLDPNGVKRKKGQ
jgi:hypothetical protein